MRERFFDIIWQRRDIFPIFSVVISEALIAFQRLIFSAIFSDKLWDSFSCYFCRKEEEEEKSKKKRILLFHCSLFFFRVSRYWCCPSNALP